MQSATSIADAKLQISGNFAVHFAVICAYTSFHIFLAFYGVLWIVSTQREISKLRKTFCCHTRQGDQLFVDLKGRNIGRYQGIRAPGNERRFTLCTHVLSEDPSCLLSYLSGHFGCIKQRIVRVHRRAKDSVSQPFDRLCTARHFVV